MCQSSWRPGPQAQSLGQNTRHLATRDSGAEADADADAGADAEADADDGGCCDKIWDTGADSQMGSSSAVLGRKGEGVARGMG